MDFEEGLNGYSSFLVSVHWQIAGMIFQTGSIETLTAAITKLLFHLSSKKPGGGLRQKLFAGAGNVFVGFSPQVISLFIKDTVANVYARKSRLKSRIKSAETANKELFLALFG